MDRNSQPPKARPPPSEDSDEGTETSDEETEDEEQAEGSSEYESDSDESTDASKKKTLGSINGKQQVVGKTAVPISPVKRTREVNGRKEKDDEPPSKKRKAEVVTPASKTATPKSAGASHAEKGQKKESAQKAEKSKPVASAKADKEKAQKGPVAEKESTKSQKKKVQSPAPAKEASKPSTSNKSEGDKGTPQKPKKPAQPWLPEEEIALSKELQKDRVLDAYGTVLPASRADAYWGKLMKRLPFMEKYDEDQRVERLCEKVRRMRLRYDTLFARLKADETNIWKNKNEEGLWKIWHTIWGPSKATPEQLKDEHGDGEDDEEEDDDDDDEEDDKVNDKQKQAKLAGRKSTLAGGTSQKKDTSSKKIESSSEEEESNKEETPMKAAAAATSLAGTHPSATKSTSEKGISSTSLQVDLNTPGTDTPPVYDHGAQGSQPGTLAIGGQSAIEHEVRDTVFNGEVHLQAVSSFCVKIVNEAKIQTEKLLEDTRARTTELVQDARDKTLQILEELRLVTQRLGSIAGQGGQLAGPSMGSLNEFYDTSFAGLGYLVDRNMSLGELNPLLDQWREQTEAETGLFLQKLQLVQETAKVQQQAVILKSKLEKERLEKERAHSKGKA